MSHVIDMWGEKLSTFKLINYSSKSTETFKQEVDGYVQLIV